MSRNHDAEVRLDVGTATAILPASGRVGVQAAAAEPDGRPRLHMDILERTAVVRFLDSEILFGDASARAIGDQLTRLVEGGGHTRLLLSFSGVQYLSGALLGQLVSLQRKLAPARGCIQLCGLEPLPRDTLRITRLDRVFDIYTDEAEALDSGSSEDGRPAPGA
jgi:anti-sigma B factor antagonist